MQTLARGIPQAPAQRSRAWIVSGAIPVKLPPHYPRGETEGERGRARRRASLRLGMAGHLGAGRGISATGGKGSREQVREGKDAAEEGAAAIPFPIWPPRTRSEPHSLE